jgi:hypothetical protein
MAAKSGMLLGLTIWCFQATLASCDEPLRSTTPAKSEKQRVEQAPPIEQAPWPRSTGNLLLPVVPVHTPPEHGRMSVWQLYGVDSTGRFRPRVIQSPSGAYYLYNFAPYLWTTTNPLVYMPYAVD